MAEELASKLDEAKYLQVSQYTSTKNNKVLKSIFSRSQNFISIFSRPAAFLSFEASRKSYLTGLPMACD